MEGQTARDVAFGHIASGDEELALF